MQRRTLATLGTVAVACAIVARDLPAILSGGSQSHGAKMGTHAQVLHARHSAGRGYAGNFVPVGHPDHGVPGDIEFFINGSTRYVPYIDGRITAGFYTMSVADGSATQSVYSLDMTKLHNAGDYLRQVTPSSESQLFNNDIKTYRQVAYILGRWHAANPQGDLTEQEMAGAIQLAIWGITNGIFDNGNLLPRPFNGAGHGIDGSVLDRMLQQALNIKSLTLSHYAGWFLKEAETHTVNIAAPVRAIQTGQSVTATATLLANDLPDSSPNGAKVTFHLTGSGKFETPSTVDFTDAGMAAVIIRATRLGTITVNARITPGTDFFDGAQALQPVTYGPQGQIQYLRAMQPMAFSIHEQRASVTPSLKIPVAPPTAVRPIPRITLRPKTAPAAIVGL